MSGGKDPAPLMSAEEKLSKKLRLRSLVRKLHDKFPAVYFNDGLHYEEGDLIEVVKSMYRACNPAWNTPQSLYIFLGYVILHMDSFQGSGFMEGPEKDGSGVIIECFSRNATRKLYQAIKPLRNVKVSPDGVWALLPKHSKLHELSQYLTDDEFKKITGKTRAQYFPEAPQLAYNPPDGGPVRGGSPVAADTPTGSDDGAAFNPKAREAVESKKRSREGSAERDRKKPSLQGSPPKMFLAEHHGFEAIACETPPDDDFTYMFHFPYGTNFFKFTSGVTFTVQMRLVELDDTPFCDADRVIQTFNVMPQLPFKYVMDQFCKFGQFDSKDVMFYRPTGQQDIYINPDMTPVDVGFQVGELGKNGNIIAVNLEKFNKMIDKYYDFVDRNHSMLREHFKGETRSTRVQVAMHEKVRADLQAAPAEGPREDGSPEKQAVGMLQRAVEMVHGEGSSSTLFRRAVEMVQGEGSSSMRSRDFSVKCALEMVQGSSSKASSALAVDITHREYCPPSASEPYGVSPRIVGPVIRMLASDVEIQSRYSVEEVIDLMSRNGDDCKAQLAGIKWVNQHAWINADNADSQLSKFLEKDGLTLVMNALKKFTRHVDIQEQGVHALMGVVTIHLALDPLNRKYAYRSTDDILLPNIVSELPVLFHAYNFLPVKRGACCLHLLELLKQQCEVDAPRITKFLEQPPSQIEKLVAEMAACYSAELHQKYLKEITELIGCHDRSVHHIEMMTGGVKQVLKSMEDFPRDLWVQKHGVEVLNRLANKGSSAHRIDLTVRGAMLALWRIDCLFTKDDKMFLDVNLVQANLNCKFTDGVHKACSDHYFNHLSPKGDQMVFDMHHWPELVALHDAAVEKMIETVKYKPMRSHLNDISIKTPQLKFDDLHMKTLLELSQ